MTERVDFYILNGATPRHRSIFACRLAEKAYLSDQQVVILQTEPSDARAMDDLLWTFSERSFVPHKLCLDDEFDPATPVHIGLEGSKLPAVDLLVNLTDRLPADLQRYARVAEIIGADLERRRLGRERFKSYRDLKLAMQTHQLDETASI